MLARDQFKTDDDFLVALRDYFAAAALTGMLSHQITEHGNVLAGAAYEVADAMLEARKP